MIRKFSDFKDKKLNEDKGKAPYRNYDEDVNANILDNPTKPRKNAESESSFEDSNKTVIKDTKVEKPHVNPDILPNDDSEFHDKDYKPSEGPANLADEEDGKKNEKLQIYGKVAKFPKGTKASNAYNFLENVKISKNRIWYIMVEKQDNELQMVKYDMKKGVNLTQFIDELKKYYITKYQGNDELKQKFEAIELAGDEEGNYSCIRNIPLLEVDGKKVITKITEDLIELLGKKAK